MIETSKKKRNILSRRKNLRTLIIEHFKCLDWCPFFLLGDAPFPYQWRIQIRNKGVEECGHTRGTADDIADWREDNKYTWHELNDLETIQLVPSKINSDFKHLGGVGEYNIKVKMKSQMVMRTHGHIGSPM